MQYQYLLQERIPEITFLSFCNHTVTKVSAFLIVVSQTGHQSDTAENLVCSVTFKQQQYSAKKETTS